MGNIVWPDEAREQAVTNFKWLYNGHIERAGAAELLAWLESTDFFTAPAGARHHGAYRGGLVKHSLNVYHKFREDLTLQEYGRVSPETVAVCGLLHDVCKVDFYRLNESGDYYIDNRFPFGHGEKSVYLISRFIRLTDEEALAIRWHMGPYDQAAKGGSRELDAAMAFSPLVYALHAADMRAAQEEKRQEAMEK